MRCGRIGQSPPLEQVAETMMSLGLDRSGSRSGRVSQDRAPSAFGFRKVAAEIMDVAQTDPTQEDRDCVVGGIREGSGFRVRGNRPVELGLLALGSTQSKPCRNLIRL